MLLKTFYYHYTDPERRFWLYKLRHPKQFSRLRTATYPSNKGDFSLAPCTTNKSIFIHITKSAGTSVAKALFGKLPYHYRAWEYRVIFGKARFEQYYKFAFVRNPWDRLYSAYCYLQGGGWNKKDKQWAQLHLANVKDFNDFVLNWLSPQKLHSHIHFWPQSDFLYDHKGKLLVNYLGYFEDIQHDFAHISTQLHIETTLRHSNRSKRSSYQSVYSFEAKEKVAQLYAQDIARFGYQFNRYQKKTVKQGRLVNERPEHK